MPWEGSAVSSRSATHAEEMERMIESLAERSEDLERTMSRFRLCPGGGR